jgi:hypothetical protein
LKFDYDKEMDAMFKELEQPRRTSRKFPYRLIILLIILGYFYNNGAFDDVISSTEVGQVLVSEKAVKNKVNASDRLAQDFKSLSKGDRKSVQYALKELGLYSGTIDGLWGVNSKKALADYDLAHGTDLSIRRIINSLNRQVIVPEHISLDGYPPPITLETGVLFLKKKSRSIAPFSIKASPTSNFYVKLRRSDNSTDVMTVLVRKGDTFVGKAPLGMFELVYASGQNWYGEKLKFGPKTQYTKSDSILTFQKSNRKINGHSISLQSVVGGNMTSQTMNSDQF